MNSDEGVCPRQQVRRIKMLMNMPSLEKLAHEIGAILDKPLPRPGQKITVRSVEDPVGKTSMLLNVYGEINGKKWGSIYSFSPPYFDHQTEFQIFPPDYFHSNR